MNKGVRKGELVEYTDDWYLNYPADAEGKVKFGVATRDEDCNGNVMVERADGVVELAKVVHAYGWAGWTPEGLEDKLTKHEYQGPDWDPDYPE